VNFDDPKCEGKYDQTNPDRGDSEAIIIGAGGPGIDGCRPARQKLEASQPMAAMWTCIAGESVS
jgi:hypothetical protein